MSIKPFPKQILVKTFMEKPVLGDEVKCLYGQVIAKGEDVFLVEVGDTIGFEKWGIKTLTIGEQEYDFIHEDSDFLLCKIDDRADKLGEKQLS